ncbi:MAG: DUF6048 family protein, partial [Marinilabiliaceae bacterium]
MFRFLSISLFASLVCLSAVAQSTVSDQSDAQMSQSADSDEEPPKENKFQVVKDQGLSLGIDLSPFIMRLVKDERTGFAVMGRYGFKNRWFANAELGYEHIKYDKEGYDYKSDGTFV